MVRYFHTFVDSIGDLDGVVGERPDPTVYLDEHATYIKTYAFDEAGNLAEVEP